MLSPSSSAAPAAAGAAWLVLLEEGPAPASPACASTLPVQGNHLLPLKSTLHQYKLRTCICFMNRHWTEPMGSSASVHKG